MSSELFSILQQFIGTILGGLISGLIGLWVENKRRANEKREKHFQELKECCLTPLESELSYFCYECFEFREDEIPNAHQMEETLKKDIHWWDYYSLDCCNKILFEDLSNHFPDLVNKLTELEKRIKQDYPKFYENILNLLKEIHSCKELNELSNQVAISKNDPELPYEAVFLVALGYDKGYWPNIYNFFKEEIDLIHDVGFKGKTSIELIYELGDKYSKSENCIRAKKIKEDIEPLIKSCEREIDEILYKKELKGKCKYM
jgi:hypothetical protein